MSDLTREQLGTLRDAAEKATMGPWSYHGPDCCEDDDSDCDATGPEAQVMYYGDSSGQCIAETWANADAHFIAAANPQTILALLDAADERDTLQQERDALAGEVAAIRERLAVVRDRLGRSHCTEGCPLEPCGGAPDELGDEEGACAPWCGQKIMDWVLGDAPAPAPGDAAQGDANTKEGE